MTFNLVEHVVKSLEQAEEHQSNLSSDILILPGLSGRKVKHLLNNLGTMKPLRYLEVGVHKGGTFISATYKNQAEFAIAVDNWSEFAEGGVSKNHFVTNLEIYAPANCILLEKNCFAITKEEIPGPINMYFYDGNHHEESQYRALTHFYGVCDNEFILLVDDWNWGNTVNGTRRAIKDLRLEIRYERELYSAPGCEADNWWNGLYVAVMQKKPEEYEV